MNNLESIKKTQYGLHYSRLNPVGEFLPKTAELYYDAQLYFLKGFFPGRRVVLDIGTGGGFIDDYLLRLGATDIETIEIDETLYKSAVKKYEKISEIQPLYGDITTFEFKKTYDLIIAFDVIEHISPDQGVNMLRKIYSLLNRGGMCIIRTDNMANIFVGNYSRYMDITHATGFTEMSLQQAFWGAGFSTCTVVSPRFKPFSKLWMKYKVNSFLQEMLIRLQDRRVPQCLHKDLLCYAIKD